MSEYSLVNTVAAPSPHLYMDFVASTVLLHNVVVEKYAPALETTKLGGRLFTIVHEVTTFTEVSMNFFSDDDS